MARLGDVVKISPSTAPQTGEQHWLLNLDMVEQQTGRIIAYNYVDADELDGSIIQFDTDAVLYSKLRPNLNKVVLPEQPGFATSEMLPLVPDTAVLTREYLTCFLRSDSFVTWAVSKTAGAKMPRLGSKELLGKEIPLPSIAEQDSIAQQFAKVDALITLRKQQIAKLDELVKARFVEMFGDPDINPHGFDVKSIGDIVTVEPQNGMYKPQSCYVQDGTGTPILRIDAFYNGKVTDFQSLKRLTCTDSEIAKYLLREHDIVINRVNSIEYLGKCAHIVGMLEPTVFESNMMRLHLDDALADACFITHLLCMDYVRKQIMNRAKKAVNQASINQTDVQSLMVLVPPLDQQHQFAAFVTQTDQQKSTIQHSLAKLEVLKKALMQKYFG